MSKKWYKTPEVEVEVEVGQVRVCGASDPTLVVAIVGTRVIYCYRDGGKVWSSDMDIDIMRKWPLHDDQDGERKRIRGE